MFLIIFLYLTSFVCLLMFHRHYIESEYKLFLTLGECQGPLGGGVSLGTHALDD